MIIILLSAVIFGVAGLDEEGVILIGAVPRSFPLLAKLPIFNLRLLVDLSRRLGEDQQYGLAL
jgi:hypothetical protein